MEKVYKVTYREGILGSDDCGLIVTLENKDSPLGFDLIKMVLDDEAKKIHELLTEQTTTCELIRR